MDIDFVTFIDAKTDKQQLWAVDLSIGYSEHVSLYRVLGFVTNGQFDSQTHLYNVKIKQAKQRVRHWQNTAQEYSVRNKSLEKYFYFVCLFFCLDC